jgi:hypothetical protein
MNAMWDDEDRAIARALDVPIDEGPVDERALDEYRRVVAQLPVDEVTPPAELEERTIAAALARRPAAATSLAGARAKRRSYGRLAALGAVAAAAAVIGGVLVTLRDSPSTPNPSGSLASAASTGESPKDLIDNPGARVGTFGGGGGAVLTSAGDGALYDLPTTAAVVIELVTADSRTAIGTATPVDGAIVFSVDRPEHVIAIRLSFASDGKVIASAELRVR